MKLPMFASAPGRAGIRRSGFAILVVCATRLPAQTTPVGTDTSATRDWRWSVNHDVRQLADNLAGTHIWSFGIAASVEREVTSQWSFEGVLHAASAPQLNFKDAPQVNESGVAVGLLWRTSRTGHWKPFLRGGVEVSRFSMDEPFDGAHARAQYLSMFGGGGIRYAVTPSVHITSDVVLRANPYGQALGFRSGVVLPLRGRQTDITRAHN